MEAAHRVREVTKVPFGVDENSFTPRTEVSAERGEVSSSRVRNVDPVPIVVLDCALRQDGDELLVCRIVDEVVAELGQLRGYSVVLSPGLTIVKGSRCKCRMANLPM